MSSTKPKSFTCAICNLKIQGQYGNNPWPVTDKGKCCNVCQQTEVLPARFLELYRGHAALIKEPV